MVKFITKKVGGSKKKWKNWRWWLKKSLLIGAALFLIGVVGVVGIFIYYGRDLPSDDELKNVEYADQSTKIYDRTGEVVLYEVHGEENRTIIDFEDIPQDIIDATLAVEDSEFYEHNGIHFRSLVRAFFTNLRGGVNSQGGSTITQQLIKNTLLTRERTIARKVKEAILAVKLEQDYSKDEILEFYINRIPYGNNAYGVQAAARTYFGKDAKDLTLAESSILAGLPNRPSYLNPYGDHIDELYTRQEHILNRMQSLGMIEEQEKEEAIQLAQVNDFFQPLETHTTIKAPHFVFYIKELLEEWAIEEGLTPQNIETDGLRVTTTLDYNLQAKAEQIVTEHSLNNESYGISNMAMAAIEPNSGEIVTMVGSRDWGNDDIEGKVNVTIRNRQPGSSFKPYVYATAFKKGYNPNTIIYDVKTNFGDDGSGRDYNPNNFDHTTRGPVSMQDGLLKSLNIPAVKTFYLAGPNDVIQTANDMGLSHLDPNGTYGLSTALGTQEVKLIDHLSALSVFGNNGVKVDRKAILKIENRDGDIELDRTQNGEGDRVLDENVADMMNSALSARTSGTLFVPGYKVAAKTGTSTKIVDGRSRPSNTWTFGWTPDLAAGFWAGNNDGTALASNAVSTRNAGPAWQAFMTEALKEYPGTSFNAPDIQSTGKGMLDGDQTIGETVQVCKYEKKLVNEDTPATQIEDIVFGGRHTILYFVDRSDPLGSRPSNPEDDPQYVNWEKAVLGYELGVDPSEITDFNVGDTAPTEYCTVHGDDKKPFVKINSPTTEDIVMGETLPIEFVANSPLTEEYDDISLKQIEIYVDGEQVGIIDGADSEDYTYDLNISSYFGDIEIMIKVFDNIDNMTSQNVIITVDNPDPSDGDEEPIGEPDP